jgi:DNA polymerase I
VSGAAVLVDASPYAFRAYFSLPPTIRDPSGRPVHAVYGFANFLLQLIRAEAPSRLAVAFDGSLVTSFRNELYPPYKAQRELPPAELEEQLDTCLELAAALGATTAIDDRYEADDLVAAWAERARREEWGTAVVVSSDKDLAQLVGPGVEFLDFAKGERYDEAAVAQRYGVAPHQIADLLALAGDPVDNIPGVAGIGKKTAAQLLTTFGSLDALYARLDELPGLALRGARATYDKLVAGREAALLSQRLSRVAPEAPAPAVPLFEGAERPVAEALFERLGFGRIRERVVYR